MGSSHETHGRVEELGGWRRRLLERAGKKGLSYIQPHNE